MKVLEIITLCWGTMAEEPRKELKHCIEEAGKAGLVSVRLFRSASLPEDIAIHLEHDSLSTPNGSHLGIRLTEALRAHGPVNHSVWRSLEGRSTT